MTCTIRIALALSLPLVALACESDPGDVGSGTNATNGGTESSGGEDSQTSATAGDDDSDSISTTSPRTSGLRRWNAWPERTAGACSRTQDIASWRE